MGRFNVSFRTTGGRFGVAFRTDPGLPSSVTPLSVTANGTYDAGEDAAYNPVTVAVPQPTGTVQINANGTVNVTDYATAEVAVPNSYTAQDEGKVVSNGALVGQTARTVTENGTYDTTENNSVQVAVPFAFSATSASNNAQNWWGNRSFSPKIDKLTFSQTYNGSSINCSGMFASVVNVDEIEVFINSPVSNFSNAFNIGGDTARKITIHADTSHMTNCQNMLNCNEVDGFTRIVLGDPINMSSIATSNNCTNTVGANITEVRFVPNTCHVSWQLTNMRKPSDETIVSVANCLNDSVTGQTLSLWGNTKTRCGEIVGTVTGGVFTIDAQGSTTLTDFITTTKGWTLA